MGDHYRAEIARKCLVGHEGEHAAREVARNLKDAISNGDTYCSNNLELLTVLHGQQPTPTLDVFFSDYEANAPLRLSLLLGLDDPRGNPLGAVDVAVLRSWCEFDRASRYPLMASVIVFADKGDKDELVWSDQAKMLMSSAPDVEKVIAVLIERLRPNSWSGSRASLMEKNEQLLHSLPSIAKVSPKFMESQRRQLAREIDAERQSELARDRERDERFE